MTQFPNLTKLDKSTTYSGISITNKNLKIIPKNSLGKGYQINHWQLSNNQIEWIDRFAFSEIKNLEQLSIENNSIQNLNFLSILEMKGLVYLYAENNSIKDIGVNVFNFTTKMDHVILRENLIVRLEAYVFSKMTDLWLLDLSFNNIEFMHSKSFAGLKSLFHFILQGN